MIHQSIEICCPDQARDIILRAVRDYTEVAFPQGASDCALVARGALLDAVKQMEQSWAETGRMRYSKRIRAFLKEAMRMHFELRAHDERRSFAHEYALLIEAIGGTPVTEKDLEHARLLDLADAGTSAPGTRAS